MQDQNLVVREARDDEMAEVYKLRYEIFCEELKFIDPVHYPEGKEFDEYDSRSYHILVLKNGRIVGYTRLILPRPGEKFLIEKAADLPEIFDREKAVEVSRGLVIPEERGGTVKNLLIDTVFDYYRRNGYEYLLSFSNKIMFDSWRKRGVNFLYVGEPLEHHGFKTWPLIITVI